LNKTFARFTASLDKSRYFESIQAHFLLLTGYRRFPSDEEFERDIQLRDLYNFRSRSYWLRRFENFDRKEVVQIEGLTIEHVMPQNDNVPAEWQNALGSEWKRIHGTYLHTLGNLTLTGYNPELSDRPFVEKRDMKGGFKDSPIRLNHELAKLDHWNEQTIKERATTLANKAVAVWSAPKMSAEMLEIHMPKKEGAKYTLEDHPQLAAPVQRELFEALRKEILTLDPNVTMEVLKLYIAFKAETNFVDIVPKTKGLVLSLNVAFGEIQDPEGRCEDVTDRGRWGNGDVRMTVASKADIPYAIGLVRQSLEKQLGQPA
jgi:predicted transport protein